MIPAQIGAYQVVDGPRAGGMSLVYGAIQPHLDRMVALKVLSPDLERDATAVERFKHEATIAARLKHDNIVTIYEANVRDPQPPYYIAMEFLRGGTLAERLAPRRPLPHDQTRWLMGQICAGLEHAHRHGVVHRDIKPANIMFDESGRPKITDFGISRAGGSGALTMVGARVGTPDYMSPEQASGKEATHLSDLYALGVVLYEILTGRPPFSSPQPLVTMRQIVDEPPPRPTGFNPTIPPRVEAVVLRALDKDPTKRYQSAGELHRALHRAYQDTAQIAGKRSKTTLIAALFSIVLLGVGLVVWTGAPQGSGGGGGGGAPHPPPRPATVSGRRNPPPPPRPRKRPRGLYRT